MTSKENINENVDYVNSSQLNSESKVQEKSFKKNKIEQESVFKEKPWSSIKKVECLN